MGQGFLMDGETRPEGRRGIKLESPDDPQELPDPEHCIELNNTSVNKDDMTTKRNAPTIWKYPADASSNLEAQLQDRQCVFPCGRDDPQWREPPGLGQEIWGQEINGRKESQDEGQEDERWEHSPDRSIGLEQSDSWIVETLVDDEKMGKPQQKEPPFIENQPQPIQIRATIARTIQKEKRPSFRQKIRNPLPFSSEPTMPREQSDPHWVQYFGHWLYRNGGPKDIVPVHPNPEKPNKKYHTPAQIHWRRQMI